jgi:hypothetical protein
VAGTGVVDAGGRIYIRHHVRTVDLHLVPAMTLKEARALQAQIKRWNYHCTVPLGWGPDGYWCQITGLRFFSEAEARKHHAKRLRERRKSLREYEAAHRKRDTRSPIERMVDRACGLE